MVKYNIIVKEVIENLNVVIQEHEIEVDGKKLKETKEMRTFTVEGADEPYQTTQIHTHWINDSYYKVQEVMEGQDVKDHEVVTSVADEDMGDFQKEWDEKWNPSVDEDMLAKAQQEHQEQNTDNKIEVVQDDKAEVLNNVVIQEHELDVDGKKLKETKETRTFTLEGADEPYQTTQILTHWINDSYYKVQEVMGGQGVKGHEVVTSVADENMEAFHNEWDEKWNPSVDEDVLAKAQQEHQEKNTDINMIEVLQDDKAEVLKNS